MVSANPDALAGVDSDRVADLSSRLGESMINLRKATQANKVSWTVCGSRWSRLGTKSLPDATPEEAQDLLWDQIFKQRASMKKTLWQLGRS